MMNELIQRVIERTGLPEDKAMMAADTVLGFLKERLPGPVGAQIDNLMNSGGNGGTGAGLAEKAAGMGSNLGDMLGGRH